MSPAKRDRKPRVSVRMGGREQYPDADGKFVNAPIFNFNDGKLKFNTNWFNNANDNYGSVSAFLPKSLLNGTTASLCAGHCSISL